ncbi:Golgi to ER traffic protein 4 homolog B-like [Diadema antillarum]|uniref:Golgi to ER traffic protein 4 homolog B-like n=1 Tax=Diadema antillarum TaxID=105358 RepID=UPI003A872CB5
MATRSGRSDRGGSGRVLAKLKKCVEDGNYYEAHQMYRTLYFRYLAQKKHAEAIELVYTGASLLLQHNQHMSGADLSLLLVEALDTLQEPIAKCNIDRIASLTKALPCESPERTKFITLSLRWSQGDSRGKGSGDPELHKQFANILWQEKNFFEARYHFLRSMDGEGCALMLVEYHLNKGYSSEVDMFIAQAVLQYLCLRNKTTASLTLRVYTENHPAIKSGPPFILPLLNFIWLLLLAVKTQKLAAFTVLCEKYQPSLQRDPCYAAYLDKIGQIFFGLPPPLPTGRQGLFGNLISSLFGGDGEDDDESDVETSTSPLLHVEDLD